MKNKFSFFISVEIIAVLIGIFAMIRMLFHEKAMQFCIRYGRCTYDILLGKEMSSQSYIIIIVVTIIVMVVAGISAWNSYNSK